MVIRVTILTVQCVGARDPNSNFTYYTQMKHISGDVVLTIAEKNDQHQAIWQNHKASCMVTSPRLERNYSKTHFLLQKKKKINKQYIYMQVCACVRPTKINEWRGEEKKRKREAQPGKRQCMSRATTGCSSQSQIYAVDSSIHALPVPRLCLSFAVPSLFCSNPHFTLPHTYQLSPSQLQLLKNKIASNFDWLLHGVSVWAML